TRYLFVAVMLTLLGGVAAWSGERADSLPRPPGLRLATLPRGRADKPNETAAAVNPRDARNAIVSYQQPIGEGADHHPSTILDGHVAWSADGGKTWALAAGTMHEGYRKSFDTS